MQIFKPILLALYVLYLRAVRAFFLWRVRVWAHAIKKATSCIERHPASFPQQGENLAYYRGKVEAARARALRAGAELDLIAQRERERIEAELDTWQEIADFAYEGIAAYRWGLCRLPDFEPESRRRGHRAAGVKHDAFAKVQRLAWDELRRVRKAARKRCAKLAKVRP